jgi:hypothetical protein
VDPTDVSLTTENESSNSSTRRTTGMSGTLVRKVATRTCLWLNAAQENLVLPLSPPPPPPQGKDLPVAPTAAVVVPTSALAPASLPEDELDPTAVAMAPVQNENKGKWTPKEDALLTAAVQKHGRKWVPIAALVPGRTNPQCRSRWLRHLDPTNGKKGRWTPKEDAKLIEAVGKLGKNFRAVATLIPGRTNERCRDRWDTYYDTKSRHGAVKGPWSQEEDAKLIEAVRKLGKYWVPVAELVYTRTNTQCRQRWLGYLEKEHGTARGSRRKSTAPEMTNDQLTTHATDVTYTIQGYH